MGFAAIGTVAVACAAPPRPLPAPVVAPDAPPLPVTVLRGERPGPTVALVAGVHGGKVAAVHAVERLARELPGTLLRGRVLLVAPANEAGYQSGLAQLSPDDSLNLNRVFPGVVCGSPTERLASRIMREIVANSDYLVDLHGSDGDEAVGRFAYAARPGVVPRVDSAARRLAEWWGAPVIVWDQDGPKSVWESRFLQTAAHLSEVPAITVFEAGVAREDPRATEAFVAGARRVLAQLGMLPASAAETTSAAATTILPRREVAVAGNAGSWEPGVVPGQSIEAGELLGTLRDSSGVATPVRSSSAGVVLHQRRSGFVPVQTPLIILGVRP